LIAQLKKAMTDNNAAMNNIQPWLTK